MKFQSVQAFGKHLAESIPHHLAPVYLIIAPCPYERRKIADQIIAALHKKDPHLLPQFRDAESVSMPQLLEELKTCPLFGSSPIVVCDGLDKLKKNGWEPLTAYAEKPSHFAFLILGAASSKNAADLYLKGKKEMVFLDLSGEKPWERKTRLHRHLIDYAHREGKTLSPDAAQHMIDQVGLELSNLEQETCKLICYVGERSTITRDDVATICAAEKSVNSWQLSESLVWEKNPMEAPTGIDLAWLLPFLGQVRYQLQIGLQLAVMCDTHMLPGDMAKQLPQLKGALFDKRVEVARFKGQTHFRSRLHHLFDIELLAKNSGGTAQLLFDLLTAKLAANQ